MFARVKLERSAVVPQPASALHITVSMWADLMFRAFWHFRTGRSFPDGVPHELLRAGGFHATVLYGILAHAASRSGFPLSWRGGRMASVPRDKRLPLQAPT